MNKITLPPGKRPKRPATNSGGERYFAFDNSIVFSFTKDLQGIIISRNDKIIFFFCRDDLGIPHFAFYEQTARRRRNIMILLFSVPEQHGTIAGVEAANLGLQS